MKEYQVTYSVEVSASSPEEAVQQVCEMLLEQLLKSKDTFPATFEVAEVLPNGELGETKEIETN